MAEVHEQTVPQILRDMAVKPLNDCGTSLLVGADYVPQLFRVELFGEGGRAHQITEHDGELPALAFGCGTLDQDALRLRTPDCGLRTDCLRFPVSPILRFCLVRAPLPH